MISDFKTVCNQTWLRSRGVVVSSAKWITASYLSISLCVRGDFFRDELQSHQQTILDKVRQMFYSWCLPLYIQAVYSVYIYMHVCDMRLYVCVWMWVRACQRCSQISGLGLRDPSRHKTPDLDFKLGQPIVSKLGQPIVSFSRLDVIIVRRFVYRVVFPSYHKAKGISN